MKDPNEQDEAKPLGDTFDLDAWEPQAPPGDFAERVLARVRAEQTGGETRDAAAVEAAPKKQTRRVWRVLGGGLAAAALAAAVMLRVASPAAHGEAIAKDRIEVAIGARALAVLEPGASVRWDGDDVVQSRGDVFYRVEKGARFTVHTPAGDVEVKGTCFTVKVRGGDSNREEADMVKRDVKAGGVGAALTALAFVAVYEGRVAVSHASERVEVGAGETAQAGAAGVKLTGATADGEKAFAASLAASSGDESLGAANQNLVRQVGEYRSRLEAIAAQKSELETKLKKSEERLAAAQDGAPAVMKHDFDLSADDWKELSKDGTIKYQMPCLRKDAWKPDAEKLNALGLAPQDADTLKNAYAHSNERIWSAIKPLCTQAVGNASLAEKIGPDTCPHIILDVEYDRDTEAAKRARTQLGEIRAGMRPMPGPNEQVHPLLKLFLALTGESKSFENELAQSFGPEEAHRIVYSDELCMGSSTWGGPRSKRK